MSRKSNINDVFSNVELFATIIAFAVLVVVYNLAGVFLASISIYGSAAWILQMLAVMLVWRMNVSCAVYRGIVWFFDGVQKVFTGETDFATRGQYGDSPT